MNDPTEIEYAASLVRETVADLDGDYSASRFKLVKKGVSDILDVYLVDNDHYIVCFCESGDLLSQWRGYGAVGGGYALGFAARHLGRDNWASLEQPEPILRKVLYDQKQQKDLLRNSIKLLFDWEAIRSRQLGNGGRRIDHADVFWNTFNWFISECLNCFKDPAFAEEKEWRVIKYGRNIYRQKPFKTEFRAGRAGIVEYAEIDVTNSRSRYKGNLPVKVIRYGPTLDPSVTERSLHLLCGEKGYGKQIQIKRSGVPFSA
jgi:hypothetical protein